MNIITKKKKILPAAKVDLGDEKDKLVMNSDFPKKFEKIDKKKKNQFILHLHRIHACKWHLMN